MSEELTVGMSAKLKHLKDCVAVGMIYLNTTNVDPATELGWGTWEALGTLTTSDSDTLYVWTLTAE